MSSPQVVANDVHHLEDTFPPFVAPPFTIKQLVSAIPPHCFERSAARSSLYVVVDLALVALLWSYASGIDDRFSGSLDGPLGTALKWTAWIVYWTLQGWVMTGVWVLGHECGHQAFSTSKRLNHAVGLVLHSLLLVPYHAWRVSHARHHAATGHLDRDQVFVPRTLAQLVGRDTPKKKRVEVAPGVVLDQLLEDAPLYRLVTLVGQQLFGWPLYLFKNVSGQTSYPAWTNHFDPNSILFDARHRSDVLLSDASLVIVLAVFASVAPSPYVGGWSQFAKLYVVPYLVVNSWLVAITFLQHTDVRLAHYRDADWTFARGALATVDREWFGPVGTWLLHGITETHVLHHVASKVPHYHAAEATQALRDVLGPEHYHAAPEGEGVFGALWRAHRDCRFVDAHGGTVMYRDAYGRARRKVLVATEGTDSGVELGTGAGDDLTAVDSEI
ncbi:hypothetical protein JCM11491_005792 [Sporobolomyces phaffii]